MAVTSLKHPILLKLKALRSELNVAERIETHDICEEIWLQIKYNPVLFFSVLLAAGQSTVWLKFPKIYFGN